MTALGHIHCIGGLEGIDKELQKGFLSTLLILRRISLLLQEVHKNRRGERCGGEGTGSLKLVQVQYVLTFGNQVYSSILSWLQYPKMCMRALSIDV